MVTATKSHSIIQKIIRSMLLIGSIGMIAKVLIFAKDLLVAKNFGVQGELDAYFIAFMLPMFVVNVVGGSFGSAFIPQYIKLKKSQGEEAASKLFSTLFTGAFFFLLSLCLLLWLSAPAVMNLIAFGSTPFTNHDLSIHLYTYLIPFIFFSGMSAVIRGLLHANEKYRLAAYLESLSPLFLCVLILWYVGALGIHVLVVGVLAGAIVEFLVLLWTAYRLVPNLFRLQWHFSLDVKEVGRQYWPMIAGSMLLSSTILIDNTMALSLDPGSVSALNYGNRLTSFLAVFGSTIVGTAVLPQFSNLISQANFTSLKQTLRQLTLLIGGLSVLVTCILCVFSEDLIRLFFQRGEFTAEDTALVGYIQVFYLLQLPFYLISTLLVRLISSLQRNHVLMWSMVISVVLNIVFNYIFIAYLGAAGIALSTSIVYFVAFLYLSAYVYFSKASFIPNE